ncbi:cyclin-T1-3-like isoform X1 [Iris pallida]|uniref:Cyclin-T1-3-like isoform X1 n=1 Tax=Iris pallida TaxID=29817 RepID=A0AAX6DXZ5_IRIPA|nr:cyclin-T1-3-like isoform X1 [Iris pallida]KAJ6846687.1 cyclin-T1-3-like isoform X1 [Iris pallida]
MAGILPGDPSHHGMVEGSPYRFSRDLSEEGDCIGSSWYLSRKEIEENSPSRKDGIDLKKEAYFRKSYCTFLQDLGMRLKVPQVTIATAIVFCHRFFLRQSHAKNDRRTIATVCMFLAGKVEETPRPLKDVILVSYEIIHKRDPAAVQRIKQKEVYEQQKELILLGERVVLATLAFDFNVNHPYKPLVEAIKKFKVAQNALAQVAWNFVNDGLRTSLCLQFKSHHIAAGAIFLAAKFLKVKLPSDGDKVWWQEFDVTPRQLEEVSNQMLELYEQNRAMASHGNETEGSSASGANHRAPMKALPGAEETPSQNAHVGTSTSQRGGQINSSARPGPDQLHTDKQIGTQRTVKNESNDHGGKDTRSGLADNKVEGGTKERWHQEPGNIKEPRTSRSTHESERIIEEPGGISETREKNSGYNEGPKGYSPLDAIKMVDKDKVKAALEKRRKARGEVARKIDVMDDDDLIERELESGIEIAAEDEKEKQQNRHSWSKPLYRRETQNPDHGIEDGDFGTGKGTENAEEGEFHSPETPSRKRRAVSPIKQNVGKDGHDHQHHHQSSSKHRDVDDSRVTGRLERERDHKRLRQENHL